MHDTFKWTRETINEFLDSFPDADLVQLAERMEQFKSSKSPKREWEIVAFRERFGIGIYKLHEDGRYRSDDFLDVQGFSLNAMLEDGDVIISVRRLSDQVIFTKNEVVGTPSDGQHHIGGFEIRGNCMYVQFSVGQISIEHLQKLPQPILITVDGVEIFPGNPCSFVFEDDWMRYLDADYDFWKPRFDGAWKGFKAFSTRHAAEEYILNNRPLLSLSDVKKIGEHSDQAKALAELTALVKQKLNQ